MSTLVRVAIVLAAGASRRMGRPKLDLDLGGETVLERCVRTLKEASLDRVRVVLPPNASETSVDNVDVVINSDRDAGLASSLKCGLSNLPGDTRWILVALADKPLVQAETIALLAAAFEDDGVSVVYPVYRGEQGHPVLFDVALVEELRGIEGDRGARAVIDAHRDDARAVEVDDPGVTFDIDTPEDYARALRMV